MRMVVDDGEDDNDGTEPTKAVSTAKLLIKEKEVVDELIDEEPARAESLTSK